MGERGWNYVAIALAIWCVIAFVLYLYVLYRAQAVWLYK